MTTTMTEDFEEAYAILHEWEGTTPQFEFDDAIDLYVQYPVQLAWWAWETATLAERERVAGILKDKGLHGLVADVIRSGK